MVGITDRGSGPRLMALLKLISETANTFTLKELADRADLPASTVHRNLQVLIKFGFVERGSDQSYRHGMELYRLAALMRSHFDLNQTARPFLERLWASSQETAVLCAYNSASLTASVVDLIPTPHPLRFSIEVGLKLTLPWGSLGRSILAYLPLDAIAKILAESHEGPLSGQPTPSPEKLFSELEIIRQQKYAEYYDPNYDVGGVAAPLFNSQGQVIGSLGLTMPSQRYEHHNRKSLSGLVYSCADELSSMIKVRI